MTQVLTMAPAVDFTDREPELPELRVKRARLMASVQSRGDHGMLLKDWLVAKIAELETSPTIYDEMVARYPIMEQPDD